MVRLIVPSLFQVQRTLQQPSHPPTHQRWQLPKPAEKHIRMREQQRPAAGLTHRKQPIHRRRITSWQDNVAKAPRSGAGSRIPPLQGCPDGMRACSCCAESFCGSALLEITQTPMSLSRGTQHLPPSKANRNHCSTQDSLGGILI